MEKVFKTPLSSLSTPPTEGQNAICLGFLDGTIRCANFDVELGQKWAALPENMLELGLRWKTKMKRPIRTLQFSEDGTALYATSTNRGVCMYDVETGKRLRCIRKGHKSRPNVMTMLPSRIGGQLHFATGTETGEIKTWDFRQSKPNVSTFNDQDDIINAFSVWKNSLLSVSGDGTLAAYDLNKQRMRIQSETMHSELLSLAVTNRFTYAGAADGHIEVFGNGEFGNIRERIETPFMGVEQVVVLRNNLLLAASSTAEEMRFVHVNPNKVLQGISHPGGVDILAKTSDSNLLIASSADGTKLKFYSVEELLSDVPELKAQDMHSFKQKQKEDRKRKREEENKNGGGFFTDLFSDEENGGEDETEESVEDGGSDSDSGDESEPEEDEEMDE